MATTPSPTELKTPPDINSKAFANNKYECYKWLREEAPVFKGKLSIINVYFLSRYDDCVNLLKDPRCVRNRTTATGGSRMPFPMPKATKLIAQSMITEDEPDHRRLRNLVHQAFTNHSLAKLSDRIEQLTNELLNQAQKQMLTRAKRSTLKQPMHCPFQSPSFKK